VRVDAVGVRLEAELVVPSRPLGVVLFAHGSGSSRHSPRNQFVARMLRSEAHVATLLTDLLTEAEGRSSRTADLRFDIPFLAGRLADVVEWLAQDARTHGLPIGLFGASTGAAAALATAADERDRVRAVVSRGGRPDLCGVATLEQVRAPTLLIVGSEDPVVLELNQEAARAIHAECRVKIVEGATHLFEEPGTLEAVAHLCAEWFGRHLRTEG